MGTLEIQHGNKFNKNIKLYFFAAIFFYIAFGAFNMLQGIYVKELNLGEDYLGLLISVKTAAIGVSAFPCALLVNKLGKKKSILISMLFISLAIISQGYFMGKWMMMISGIFQGVFNALLSVTEAPFLMENSGEGKSVKLFSYTFAISTFASMVGYKICGRSADVLSVSFTLVNSYRYCIIAAGLVGLISIFFVLQIVDKKLPVSINTSLNSSSDKGILILVKNSLGILKQKNIKEFLIYNSLIGFGAGLVVPYFNVYLKYKINISSDMLGTIMSISMVAMGVGGLIMPYIARKFGKANAIIICQIASIPFLLLIATPPSIIVVSIAFFMRSALMNMAGPIIGNISMELVESENRSILSSLNNVSNNLSRALSAVIAGFIMKNFARGYEIPYYITTVLYVVGAIYFYKNFKSYNNSRRSYECHKDEGCDTISS